MERFSYLPRVMKLVGFMSLGQDAVAGFEPRQSSVRALPFFFFF